MERSTWSPRRLARTAGALYALNIIGGMFAIGIVPALVIVTGNPAATVHALQAHEPLYRTSLVVRLLVDVTNLPLAVIFWELFRVVNRRLALLVVGFMLVGTAVEAGSLLGQYAPLTLLDGALLPGALPADQLANVAYAELATRSFGYDLTALFFGCYCVAIGYLIARSSVLPRTIGILLAADGACYLVSAIAGILDPAFAASLVPWIQLPSLAGEGALCLWLLFRGVDARRWLALADLRAATAVSSGATAAVRSGVSIPG